MPHVVAELALGAPTCYGRVGARVQPVDHPHFDADVATICRPGRRTPGLPDAAQGRAVADVQRAVAAIDARRAATALPLHVLIETHGARAPRPSTSPRTRASSRCASA